jgi:glycosyltransferase involved in cell wall biosynthesis
MVKFLLPLHNDALALPLALGLIDTICHRGSLAHEVVAVDDASDDGTPAEARRFAHLMPLWLIQHGRPMGRSLAYRTALEAACRDVCDADLLIPIDPRSRPDPEAVLGAITAARDGWNAVSASAVGESWHPQNDHPLREVLVYRAGLIRQYLAGFLETPPRGDAEALRQLDQHLRSMGVSVHYLPARQPRRPVLQPLPGSKIPAASAGSRGR